MRNRFFAVVRKMRDELEHAAQRKFGYLHTALEADLVGNAKFARLVRSGAELSKTTSPRVETEEEKSLRQACANQLVVGLMDWLGPDTVLTDAYRRFCRPPSLCLAGGCATGER